MGRVRVRFDFWSFYIANTVKLGDKERFDEEQIGLVVKEPFPVTKG